MGVAISMMMEAQGDLRPEPPRAPEPNECCESGCDPCVYDRYWEACASYEQALADWQARQPKSP